MSTYQLLTTTAELEAFCQRARQFSFLALDTEFVRTRTYYAKLGLVQVKAGHETVLIDPLEVSDLSSLWQLLSDNSMTIVIHAGGEDYEILAQAIGKPITQVFDTQIAAAFAGIGDAMGYAALVQHYTEVELDKSQSRTDWMQRPLAPAQLDYAAADVIHLHDIYPRLVERLQARGNNYALALEESEFQVLKRAQGLQQHALEPYLYLFFGNAWQCNRQQLAVLRELLIWRQRRAQQADIPLSFVAKDHTILELARRMPRSDNDLHGITDLSPMTRKYGGKAILAAVTKGVQLSESEWPRPLQRLTDMNGYKPAFKAIKSAVDKVAAELDIAATMVGSRRQINDVMHWQWQVPTSVRPHLPLPDLYTSWRGAKLKTTIETILQ